MCYLGIHVFNTYYFRCLLFEFTVSNDILSLTKGELYICQFLLLVSKSEILDMDIRNFPDLCLNFFPFKSIQTRKETFFIF